VPCPCRQRGRRQRRKRAPADPPNRQRQLGPPGGGIDLGESVAQAAVRETLEESGIECVITGIVGIYSDPKHVIFYTSNGEAPQEFSIVLTARPLGGQPTPSSESSEVRWVPESELPGYTMDRSMRIRINDFLARNESPAII
jgi:8-oxo-dGTP pyrophosphatase MutT (NUDIX family)